MNHFIYLVRPNRPNLIGSLTPDEAKILDDHFDYLKRALEANKLILAGPCLDAAFGVAIFKSDTLTEAQLFMEEDPAVKHGVFTAELHPYKISLFGTL